MPNHAELIDKLEKATEGSRELDCLIHELFSPQHTPTMRGMYYGEPTGEYYEPEPGHPGGYVIANAPRFTTSIDAIVALIERTCPGSCFALTSASNHATVAKSAVHMAAHSATAATLALALCIALLRALQHQGGGNG